MTTVVRNDKGMYHESVGTVKLIKDGDRWDLYIDGESVQFDKFLIEDNSNYEEVITMSGEKHRIPWIEKVTYT